MGRASWRCRRSAPVAAVGLDWCLVVHGGSILVEVEEPIAMRQSRFFVPPDDVKYSKNILTK